MAARAIDLRGLSLGSVELLASCPGLRIAQLSRNLLRRIEPALQLLFQVSSYWLGRVLGRSSVTLATRIERCTVGLDGCLRSFRP